MYIYIIWRPVILDYETLLHVYSSKFIHKISHLRIEILVSVVITAYSNILKILQPKKEYF